MRRRRYRKFIDEQCLYDDDDATWCKFSPVYNHTKSMSATLGEAGNSASERLASCAGATRFRGQRDRGSVDDSWKTLFDVDVPSNTTWRIHMSYDHWWHGDANFRFVGDGYGTAWHRYAGAFNDWQSGNVCGGVG